MCIINKIKKKITHCLSNYRKNLWLLFLNFPYPDHHQQNYLEALRIHFSTAKHFLTTNYTHIVIRNPNIWLFIVHRIGSTENSFEHGNHRMANTKSISKIFKSEKRKMEKKNLSSLSMLVGVKRRQNPSFVEQDNRFWLSHNENIQNNIIIYKSLWSEKRAIENDIMVSKWDPNVWKTQKSNDENKDKNYLIYRIFQVHKKPKKFTS